MTAEFPIVEQAVQAAKNKRRRFGYLFQKAN